jgi:glycosyltransferase involved in cell wall biosynthesis
MTQVLGRALAKSGHEVRTIGVYPEWYGGADFEESDGVRIWRLREKQGPLGWVYSRYKLYQTVSAWCRTGAIDLIETPDYQGWVAGWKRLNVPIVTRIHGSLTYFASELNRPIDKTTFWLERSSLLRSDYLFSVSRYTAEITKRVFNYTRDSKAIVYNPVELPVPGNGERSTNRIVFSGTLTPKKGVKPLIMAWRLIADQFPGAELHVYGKDGRAEDGGSMRHYLSSLLDDRQRAGVHFHGHVSREQLFESYRTATVAVFPSYAEAFAIAPLEAMACGCPTIYSLRGSGPELLNPGTEGLLVDPDDPRSIADAALQVLRDRSFARKLGEFGRQRVQQMFSIDRLLELNIGLYEDCIRDFHLRSSPK